MRERLRQHGRFLTLGAGVIACVLLAACVPPPPPPPPGTVTGLGFDTCGAPSTRTMDAWLNSPYRAIGVYIGGETRACSQPNLNATWVSQVGNEGWRVAPLYVGLQDACNSGFGSNIINFDTNTAFVEGETDAGSAANEASALQLGPGYPIYLDLESYPTGGYCTHLGDELRERLGPGAARPRLRRRRVLERRDRDAGSPQLPRHAGRGWCPDVVWFAHWNGIPPTVFGDSYIPDVNWANHQRIHQYQGGHDEVWGGVDISIDNDAVDAPLGG